LTDNLRDLLDAHRRKPFPEDVHKGTTYGEVDPVRIDADLYGWCARIEGGETFHPDERRQFETAFSELANSLSAFPESARPYFEGILRFASVARSR
jgi:hypothetical protein